MANLKTVVWQCLQKLRRLLGGKPRIPRQLRLCENLQLGDRRFLSIIEFGKQRFLLGGTATSLAILATLPQPGSETASTAAYTPAERIREIDEN